MPLADKIDKKQFSSPFSFHRTVSSKISSTFRQPVLLDKDKNLIKVLKFDSPRLNKIYFKSGMNLVFGPTDTGKTNSCLTLAFKALNLGWKVIYYDLEDGVDPERLVQIYKSHSWSFPFEKLYSSFVKPARLDWKEITDDFARIINLEKPDLFVVDSFSALFMKEFMRNQRDKWFVTNKRERLCFDFWEQCHNSKSIVIIVAHSKTKSTKKKDDFKAQISSLASEPELFSGIGNRIAYLSKQWVYFFKVIDDNDVLHRYMAIFKRKVGKDYFDSKELIEFKITDRGVE